MKTIEILGVIGWEVFADDIREQFKSANGEEIELLVSSPGGSVWEALGIFNAIRDHSQKVTAKILDIAASAAAYIISAADEIQVYDNSVFMVHNPLSGSWGDYREFQKMADFLDSVSKMMAKGFAQKTGKSIKEIRQLFDDETWLFGDEIVDSGFAQTAIESEKKDDDNPIDFVARAKLEVNACYLKMHQDPEKMKEYQQKACVYIDIPQEQPKNKQEKNPMNLEELKKNHPDLFDSVFQSGVKSEHDRVLAHLNFLKADIAKDHAIEAIEKGSDFSVVEMSFYQVEGTKTTAIENRVADNPDPIVDTPTDDVSDEDKKNDLSALVDQFSIVKPSKTNK